MCQTPDTFLAELYGQAQQLVVASPANARRNISKSGVSPRAFLDLSRDQKLSRLEKQLQKHIADL